MIFIVLMRKLRHKQCVELILPSPWKKNLYTELGNGGLSLDICFNCGALNIDAFSPCSPTVHSALAQDQVYQNPLRTLTVVY